MYTVCVKRILVRNHMTAMKLQETANLLPELLERREEAYRLLMWKVEEVVVAVGYTDEERLAKIADLVELMNLVTD